MIRFSLRCTHDHEFEAWFRSNDDFTAQQQRSLVECPVCGSKEVDKALMAPAVSTALRREQFGLAAGAEQKQALAQIKALVTQARENSEYVGDRFAEEARRIHFGETDARGIYGEATVEEARSLAEDGVSFMPLPVLPDDQN